MLTKSCTLVNIRVSCELYSRIREYYYFRQKWETYRKTAGRLCVLKMSTPLACPRSTQSRSVSIEDDRPIRMLGYAVADQAIPDPPREDDEKWLNSRKIDYDFARPRRIEAPLIDASRRVLPRRIPRPPRNKELPREIYIYIIFIYIYTEAETCHGLL